MESKVLVVESSILDEKKEQKEDEKGARSHSRKLPIADGNRS